DLACSTFCRNAPCSSVDAAPFSAPVEKWKARSEEGSTSSLWAPQLTISGLLQLLDCLPELFRCEHITAALGFRGFILGTPLLNLAIEILPIRFHRDETTPPIEPATQHQVEDCRSIFVVAIVFVVVGIVDAILNAENRLHVL